MYRTIQVLLSIEGVSRLSNAMRCLTAKHRLEKGWTFTHIYMKDEAGSSECRALIAAKESLITTMSALSRIKKAENILNRIKDIYTELEEIHEERKMIENEK